MKYMQPLRRQEGQSTVEYALILALVAGLLVILWQTVGPKIEGKIKNTGTAIDSTNAPGN